VCTGAQEYFRDVHDHLARIQNAIDTMRDTIGTAIQVNLSMVTIEESETTKRLAAWAAIFAVSTAMAGIWGMNFEHMPELKWALATPWRWARSSAPVPCCTGVSARRLAVLASQIGF
jgi:magnesium transporter